MDLRIKGSSSDCMTLCAPVMFAGVPSLANLTRVVQRGGTRQRGNLLVLQLGFGHVA
jgi:hypothetical protein